MMKTITKIPSFSTVRKHTTIIPKMYTEKQLINSLASLIAFKTAYRRNLLPTSFYNTCAYGPIPRDPWLLKNAEQTITEIEQELSNRHFTDWSIFIEID